MKKTIFSIFLVLFSILQASAQGFTYQGIATDSNDVPISSKTVRFKMSILKNSSTGTSIYNEEQVINTNANGVFSLLVGSINPIAFDTITWGNGDKYLKVELDVTGNSFALMGTTKLQNVPFAYQAKNTAKIQGVSISITKPATGQVLTYENGEWIPKTPITYSKGEGISIDANNKISTDLTGTNGVLVDGKTITGTYKAAGKGLALNGTTFTNTAPVPTGTDEGQVVTYDGTNWIAKKPNPKYVPGSGISITDSIISNTAAVPAGTVEGQVLTYKGNKWVPQVPVKDTNVYALYIRDNRYISISEILSDVIYSIRKSDSHTAYDVNTGIYTVPITGIYSVQSNVEITTGSSPQYDAYVKLQLYVDEQLIVEDKADYKSYYSIIGYKPKISVQGLPLIKGQKINIRVASVNVTSPHHNDTTTSMFSIVKTGN